MRKITVSTIVSPDGVMGSPGEWGMQYFDEAAQTDGLKRLLISDAMLLGRTTYEALARAWSHRTGGFADRINSIPKFVFSSTLPSADWGNAVLISGDIVDEARRLKEQGERDLVIFGHGRLTKALLTAGLIDELRLLIMPILAGRGELLFTEIGQRNLALTQSTILPSGVVILVYAIAQD
jgi:dihydrofolate reductase